MFQKIDYLLIGVLSLVLFVGAAPQVYGGGGPVAESSQESVEGGGSGTDTQGKSNDFVQYLNEDSGPSDKNSIELIKIDDNSNVEIGGEEDPELALKRAY